MIKQEESSKLQAVYFIHVKSELETVELSIRYFNTLIPPSRDYRAQKVLKEFHHLKLIISCRKLHFAFLLELTQQDGGAAECISVT